MYEFSALPPERVTKRDGRVVPFDADKISRALFAATESLGRPDAFLARELTDGVVHFLADENDGRVPTTERIAERVAQVVRELGQPALAEAFTGHGRRRERGPRGEATPEDEGEVVLRFPSGMAPAAVLAACARSYSLQAVYARDLFAAQSDGLLTLTGLEHPGELEGCVLDTRPPARGAGPAGAVAAARRVAGQWVTLDGLEYDLAEVGGTSPQTFARELDALLRVTGLSGVVNLNVSSPPPRAGDLASGPLFAGQEGTPPRARRSELADALLDELLHDTSRRVRVDWHLSAADFEPEARGRLERVAHAALDGAPVAFAFDRPKRPLALAEGADRANPTVLLTAGLNLPGLMAREGLSGDAERFLRKLPSLARLALSAGVQKRAFLRRRERSRAEAPTLSSGFLLERARLVVTPEGLDEVVRAFTGAGLIDGGRALDLGGEIIRRLRDVLSQDGRHALLETCVDAPATVPLTGSPAESRDRLRAAGAMQTATGCGTVTLALPDGEPVIPSDAAEWLRFAWQRTDMVRLRFSRLPASQ